MAYPDMTLEDRYMFYCMLSSEIEFQMQRYTTYVEIAGDPKDGHEDRDGYPYDVIGTGLCALVKRCFEIDIYDRAELKDILPELHELKPPIHGIYWFPTNLEGWEQRLALVNQCIKETELQLHNQNQSS